ncbi:PLP-dependent aminotransferase family protein [Proteiniborus sp. MB09-C3]|uniref:MocR-like pyridoxine biosynthesis transcription factor PdxR n=1 Tax=Proteiniborus sp. MB09-C3 TaxID=3050072 RepID=UPI00255515E0|nr:PLP-dependent aminotransferase family protein [Proteiniborus sp. MB09-C3]WIV10943.1 PLP-dependent aminotransferase family protein [Proteiniborus sp. MB09-C3]
MERIGDIKLDKSNNKYLYLQLFEEIKRLIESNNIEPHTKLPTIRYLANKLGVNNSTIVNAYNQLETEGYIYKKIGSGTFVQDIRSKEVNKLILDEETSMNLDSLNLFLDMKKEEKIINFASTAPMPDLFPIDDFKIVLNEVLDRDKGRAFTYQESQGYLDLRKAISNYLSGFNIKANENNIHIISGAQQGIDILSKALIEYGSVVFTENPTYTGAIAVFKSRSARIVEIPINKDGIDLIDLEYKLRSLKPKFIYVMPNFQNPTGYSYTVAKMKKLIELAVKHNFYIIEDDYLSDLHLFNQPKNTLKSLDTVDKVIYIKSFSKIFMPGLRLAFMIIPQTIYSEVLSAKHISDISTSGLIQRAFHLYLEKGIWQKHIERMSTVYSERYNTIIKSIKKYMPKQVKYTLPQGGLNFWFSLPSSYSANELYKLCLKNGITIAPGSLFDIWQRDTKYFRLSIASVHKDEIDFGIAKLSQIINFFLKNYQKDNITIDLYNNLF